jgi:hypothetical protein
VESLLTVAQGLAWDPQIRGILAVLVGVVVLGGSVFLLLSTNVGARLGMLLALAGVFGWMAIVTLFWWVNPPAIGPSGDPPFWQVTEVHVTGGDQPPVQTDAQFLPPPGDRITPEQLLDESPALAEEFQSTPELSDIAGADPDAVPDDLFGGWSVVPTADAGEAQAAADAALVEEGIFATTADYEHTSVFEIGGKTPVTKACDFDDPWLVLNACKAWHRVKEPFLTHPSHYAVVEVQPVIAQEALPGQPPPTPIIDETQPAIWVVMDRQLGTTRTLPFTYFVISFIGFIIFATILHYRDKTLKQNLEQAETAPAGA